MYKENEASLGEIPFVHCNDDVYVYKSITPAKYVIVY